MLTIAHSGRSQPSALAIQNQGDDVVIVRSQLQETDINWGRAVANSKLNPNISNVTNKRVMRELFQEHGVPMPRLLDINEVVAHLGAGGTVIGRPDQHMKGRGYWKITDLVGVKKAKEGTRRKRAATHFMEFVESEREYRVHVFNGKSIRISEKDFENPHDDGTYTTKKPGDIRLRRVRDAAKLAVEATGLDFGAVDILTRGDNNETVFVLEVNAAPGLGGTMPKLWYDTFKQWKEEQE